MNALNLNDRETILAKATHFMSDRSTSAPISPQDALPPVQPPTFGFLIQLFVIPAIIVCVLLGGWYLFSWLVSAGGDPQSQLETIRSGNKSRWQAAYNLAEQLGSDTNGTYRNDAKLCRQVIDILEQSLQTDLLKDEEDLKKRSYLASTLGFFTLDEQVPVLIKAAKTVRDPAENIVRLAAVESLGKITNYYHGQAKQKKVIPGLDENGKWRYDAEIHSLLLELSENSNSDRDDMSNVRQRAAFILGEFETLEAEKRLKELLSDAKTMVRFNAATSLANLGKTESLGVLLEMLRVQTADFQKRDSIDDAISQNALEKNAIMYRFITIKNGWQSFQALRERHPEIDAGPYMKELESLQSDKNKDIRNLALEAVSQMKKPVPTAEKK
jgi:hypothetical protein